MSRRRALTSLSRWAAAWIPLLPGAIAGAVLPSPTVHHAPKPVYSLASVALKELHLYFVAKLQPCDPIGGNGDRVIVLPDGTVAMVTDSTCTGYRRDCCLGVGRRRGAKLSKLKQKKKRKKLSE